MKLQLSAKEEIQPTNREKEKWNKSSEHTFEITMNQDIGKVCTICLKDIYFAYNIAVGTDGDHKIVKRVTVY